MQLDILKKAAKGVKAGGRLVYGTCSLFDCENEHVVNEFLGGNHDFKLETFPHPLTGKQVKGMLRIWPDMADSDAVFVACIRRIM